MKKSVRMAIYVAFIALAWFILAPALSINPSKIGGPIKELLSGWNTMAIVTLAFAIGLAITYIITSGWGLIMLGGMALLGLVAVSILHPYLFPALTPLFALWVFCAVARRKAASAKA